MRYLLPLLRSFRAGALASATFLAACSSSSGGGGLAPITAIVVPADDLTRETGCGSDAGKIFKYVAVVSEGSAAGDAGTGARGLARGVYDCFVDANFSFQSGFDDTGSAFFRIDIVAVDATEYETQKTTIDAIANTSAALDLASFEKLRGAIFTCDATLRINVASTAECQRQGRR